MSVMASLEFDWWDIAAVFVEAVTVRPVGPACGGQLDVFDGSPGLVGFDQLSLVQAVDGLGGCVVIMPAPCRFTAVT